MLEETTYDYDPAGNLIEKIDAKDQKTTYVYDDAGRLEEINYFAASADMEPAKTVTFTYDEIGNLTGYDDGTTSATYGYDDLYRKISESVNYGAFTKTNAYTYLKNGLKETYTGSDDITYGYLYDANNQLTGVQVPNLGFITINEYSWNRPASMTLPGGTTKNFSYDPLMRIKQIETKDPGENVLLNYQYNYDKMDNITSKDTEHGAYGYDYDDLYRLKTVDNPVQDDEAFTYDLVGNRLTAVDTDGDWTYNGNNELVTSAPSSAGTTGETTFDYDANGNMIQKTVDGVVTSYVYNIEDRLTQIWNGEVDTGSLTAEYYYDPFGRRLWKEVSGVRTYFHYADEGLVAEIDSAGTETKSYGYKPGSTWTTDPLFMKVGSEYYFYHNDHLGTPQKITAVNGTIVWDAKYSSFGEATVEVATVENNLRFPGQYYDSEENLNYSLSRYYDFALGRYIKKEKQRNIYAPNSLFVYVDNNPIMKKEIISLIIQNFPKTKIIIQEYIKPTVYHDLEFSNTVACIKGELQVHEGAKGGGDECTKVHEESHIPDFIDRYGPDVCRGVPDYQQPGGGAGYREFYYMTECKAHRAGKKCREEKINCQKDYGDKIFMQGKLNADEAFIDKHCK